MGNQQHVIIIGAGIVGCSIAFSLSKRGFSTLNIDPLPASGYGSTSHSSAVIRPIYSHTTACAIAHESRFIWKQWRSFLGLPENEVTASYTECGGMVLVREGDDQQYAANLAAMQEVGVEFEVINEREISALYPNISLSSYGPPKKLNSKKFAEKEDGRISSAILVPAAGYVSDPQLACRNLQQASELYGAKFRFATKVVEILSDGETVSGVKLNNDECINADIVINAAGPHSSQVNQLAGIADKLKISTSAQRHEVVYLKADANHFKKTDKFIVDLDAGVYMRPDADNMLIGSTDPVCDSAQVVDPDDYNTQFTEQWTVQAYRAAQRFPNLGISNTARGTVGLYDVTEDWVPIYDCSDLHGFYMAIGTSGNQFKNAPLIGEIMAQIIGQNSSGCSHDKDPAILHLKHLNRSVGLEFYSRNREVGNTNSVLA